MAKHNKIDGWKHTKGWKLLANTKGWSSNDHCLEWLKDCFIPFAALFMLNISSITP